MFKYDAGSRWVLHATLGMQRERDSVSLKMPLGTMEETSAGLPFKAALSENQVQLEVSTCEPVTLPNWRLGGEGRCVWGGGFRSLVLGGPSTHSHVCRKLLRPFC